MFAKNEAFFNQVSHSAIKSKTRLNLALFKNTKHFNCFLYLTVDKEEIMITAEHLLQRLHGVDVQVVTPRNNEQQKALAIVNDYIERLLLMHKTNVKEAINLCQLCLNTCSPDFNNLPVDDKFQESVIACTAEDQKKTRKRLEALKSAFETQQKR